jgi:hypothetical protein
MPNENGIDAAIFVDSGRGKSLGLSGINAKVTISGKIIHGSPIKELNAY